MKRISAFILGSLSIVGVNPKKQNKRIRQAMAEKLSLVFCVKRTD